MRIRASFQTPMKKTKKKNGLVAVYRLWHWVAPLSLPICGFPPMVFPLLLPGAVAERFRFPVQEFVVRMTSL